MSSTTTRKSGVVESWNDGRGFGFLRVEGSGRTVFVHISAFPQGNVRPEVGDQVTFTVEPTGDGRSRAAFVQFTALDPRRLRPVRSRSSRASDAVAFVGVAAFVALYVLVQVLWGPLSIWVLVLYVGASLLNIVAYGADKSASMSGGRRIPESSLIALGIIGGWPGGVIAQRVFRHKTRKVSFRISFWGAVLLNVIAFVLLASPVFRVALTGVFELWAA